MKIIEFKKTVSEKFIDILLVIEFNITYENMQYYKIMGYSQHIIPRARQITSRI